MIYFLKFPMFDNAFVHIANYTVANQLANEFDVETLHLRLDESVQHYCPVVADLNASTGSAQRHAY
jgi:hypothetical protein